LANRLYFHLSTLGVSTHDESQWLFSDCRFWIGHISLGDAATNRRGPLAAILFFGGTLGPRSGM